VSKYQVVKVAFNTSDCELARSKMSDSAIGCTWLRSQDTTLTSSNLRAAFVTMFDISYRAEDCDMTLSTPVDLNLALTQITAEDRCSITFGIVAAPGLACSADVDAVLLAGSSSAASALPSAATTTNQAATATPGSNSITESTDGSPDSAAIVPSYSGSLVGFMSAFLQETELVAYLTPSSVSRIILPSSAPSPSASLAENVDGNGKNPAGLIAASRSKTPVAASIAGVLIGLGALAVLGAIALRRRRSKLQAQRKKMLAGKDLGDPSMWAEVAVLRGDGKDASLISRLATPTKNSLFDAKKTTTASAGVGRTLNSALGGVANPLAATRMASRTLGEQAVGAAGSDRRLKHAETMASTRSGVVTLSRNGSSSNVKPDRVRVDSNKTAFPFRPVDKLTSNPSADAPMVSHNPANRVKKELAPKRASFRADRNPLAASAPSSRQLRPAGEHANNRASAVGRRRTTFGQARPRALNEAADDAALSNALGQSLEAAKRNSVRHLDQLNTFKPLPSHGGRALASNPLASPPSRSLARKA
jgi:hypothetical protein